MSNTHQVLESYTAVTDLEADTVLLALCGGVGVVAAEDEAVAGEAGLLGGRHDGVVGARLPGDRVTQPVQRVVTLALCCQGGPGQHRWGGTC